MLSKTRLFVASSLLIVGLIGLGRFIFAATSFVPGDQPTGTIAPLTVTNFNLTSGNELVFKIDYERQDWTGNVYAYPIAGDGTIIEAGERYTDGVGGHVNAQDFNTGRNIVTMKSDGTKIPFRWASLSGAQQTAVVSANVVNFVRGDRSLETGAGGFRVRASVLGDIIHANPVYMENGGTPVLFVGANDGMLHVFDAHPNTGGKELWAYVPSMLMSQLPALKALPYVHTYFVDGGLNLGNAVISGVTKKILVGGLGAGGKGLFALDVTDPLAATEIAAATKILWEISPTTINNIASGSYANMGYTYGTPVIVPVNSGSGQSAVIIGNGYVNTGNLRSSLFVINAANGSLLREIIVPTASPSGTGGLSTPACIDTNSDGRADFCYAGDIDGKLWKFDLTSTSPAAWSVSLLHTTSPAQAITMAPAVGVHPNGGFMINFGTGRLLTAADSTDTSVFYAYGIWDGAPAANAVLLSQTLTTRNYVSGSVTTKVRSVTGNTPNWTDGAANHMGWRVALPAGERVTGDTVFIESGRFYFNAANPTVSNASPPNGENWLMELDFLSGGVANNSPFLDLNGDQLVTNLDRIQYIAADPPPAGSTVGSPIMTTAGIAVGKFISNGVGSHPLLVQLTSLNTTLFNNNPDVILPPLPPPSTEPGVAGGHFDVDIYYGTNRASSSQQHFHQYDDKFDVTGVNMLNASSATLNLSNGITSTATNFKVLVQNQYLNPAVQLLVGANPYTPVKTYNNLASETVAANVIANAPVYNRANIGNLVFNMPVDVFTPKDYWGNGDVRVGLHPTVTGCVKDSSFGGSLFEPVNPPPNGKDGPGTNGTTTGVRHNGALVIQLIKDTTPASAIELNVAGRPEYGWRVRAADFENYVLTEWTVFWHHPNGKCYGQSGWTKTPPSEPPGSAKSSTPAAGSADPKDGNFGTSGPVDSVVITVVGNITTIVTTYQNKSTMTETRTKNSDGTITIVTVLPDKSTTTVTIPDAKGKPVGGGDEKGAQAKTGRISWSELIRN